MRFRVIAVIVTLFWGGSLCWLGMVVWAPPESRMAQVDAREVYDVFFGWNDSTTMTLLESGARRGIVTVSGGSGEDPVSGEFTNVISITSAIENGLSSDMVPNLQLFWKGTMEFSEAMEPGKGTLSVRIPSKQLTAHLELDGATKAVKAKAVLGKQQVFNYDSEAAGGSAVIPAQLLAMSAGPFSQLLNPAEMTWETEARMGKFSFGGRDLRAYLLVIRMPEQGQELKIYISEAGEPLRIESALGFEAVSEILVPLDAYRKAKPVQS
ncbi:hypothetical protein VSU19_13155 [Verrucomicrobiales bacterium BCK34]|nr:hypothetical protein [Verrucomicrobiales bacterium BCK34]